MTYSPFKLGIATGAGLPTDANVTRFAGAGCQAIRGGVQAPAMSLDGSGHLIVNAAVTNLDDYIRRMNAAGMDVWLQVADGNTDQSMDDPAKWTPYGKVVIELIYRYRVGNNLNPDGGDLRVAVIECGNEPNLDKWSATPNPEQYVRMMDYIYNTGPRGGAAGIGNIFQRPLIANAGIAGTPLGRAGPPSNAWNNGVGRAPVTDGTGTHYESMSAPEWMFGMLARLNGAPSIKDCCDVLNTHRYTYDETSVTRSLPSNCLAAPTGNDRGWVASTIGNPNKKVADAVDGTGTHYANLQTGVWAICQRFGWSPPHACTEFGAPSPAVIVGSTPGILDRGNWSATANYKLFDRVNYGSPSAKWVCCVDAADHSTPGTGGTNGDWRKEDHVAGVTSADWISIHDDATLTYAQEPTPCWFFIFTDIDVPKNDNGKLWGLWWEDNPDGSAGNAKNYLTEFTYLATHGPRLPGRPASIALPVELGVCVPFAGGSSGTATAFGLKPRLDSLIGTGTAGPTKIKRSDMDWSHFQPTNTGNKPAGQNDSVNTTELYNIVDAAFANGYKLIIMFGYTPQWAAGAGGYNKNFPRDAANGYRDYANALYLLGVYCEARHAGVVLLREVWNEPNQQPFFATPDINEYIKMLSTGYDSAFTGVVSGRSDNGTRTVVPQGCQVMTGGTGGAPSAPKFRHAAWTNAIISNAPQKFDHIGIHPYTGPYPLGPGGDASYDPGRNDIPSISAALHTAGRDDAQIIATEAGWKVAGVGFPAREVTLQQAADFLDTSWNWWVAHSGSRTLGGTNYGLGPYCLFECDDTDDSTKASSDANNIQGLYTQGAGGGAGISKKDSSGTPVYLNKYLQYAGLPTGTDNPPTGSIMYPTAAQNPVSGNVSVLILANDTGTPSTPIANLKVKVYCEGTKIGNAVYTPAGAPYSNFKLDVNTNTAPFTGDGTYSITGTIDDGVNTPVTTAAFSMVVQNAGPTVPVISSLDVTTGPAGGGTTVHAVGTGFTGITGAAGVKLVAGTFSVNVGTGNYTVVDDTHVTFTTPAQPTGGGGMPFPLFVTFGAGMPTIPATKKSTDPISDIDGIVAVGAEGIRMSIDFDAAMATDARTPTSLNTAYMNRVADVIKYCNNCVLWNGTVGLKVDLQLAIGSIYGAGGGGGPGADKAGSAYNEKSFGSRGYQAAGTPPNGPLPYWVNVPKAFAEFGAAVVDYFKPSRNHGIVWSYELGNEPNHSKWDDPTDTYNFIFAGVTGGTFKVHCMGADSPPIAWNATAAQAQAIYVQHCLDHADSKAATDINAITKVTKAGTTFSFTGLDKTTLVDSLTPGSHTVTNTRNFDGSGVWKVDKGKAYLKCFAHFVRAALAADPAHGYKLLIGGLGGHRDSGMDVTTWDFTRDVYAASVSAGEDYDTTAIAGAVWSTATNGGIGLFFDMWNYHPYCYQSTPTEDLALFNPDPPDPSKPPTGSGGQGWAEMHFLVAPIHVHYGTHTRGALITEWGTPSVSGGFSDGTPYGWQHEADCLDSACYEWGRAVYGGATGTPLSVFCYSDKYPDSKGRPYGLVRMDPGHRYEHKTAYWNKYHALAQTHTSGPAVPNTFDVIMTNTTGPSVPVTADQFTYGGAAGSPIISAVTPNHGLPAGGDLIGIYGQFFTGVNPATGVTIGGNLCTSVIVWSDSAIGCLTPAGTAGDTKNVKVVNPTGQSTPDNNSKFKYDLPTSPSACAVTGLVPSHGLATGGYDIVIQGVRFLTATGVLFGTTPATSYTITDDTHITAKVPPGSGTQDVHVVNAAGPSQTVSADQFLYDAPPAAPTVSLVTPASGPQVGGTDITVDGANFVNVTGVTIGGVACTKVKVLSNSQLTCRTGGGVTKGGYDVIVTNTTGSSPTGGPQFSYGNNPPTMNIVAVILADGTTVVSPPSGKISGTVTLILYAHDEEDTTVNNVRLLEGSMHQNDRGAATVYPFGYYIKLNTKIFANGPHTFWASGGPDSGGLTGLSAGYVLDIQNGGGTPGMPPPKRVSRAVPPEAAITEAILSGSTHLTRRAEILNADLTPWRADVPILGGSVNVDASRDERRSFDIEIGFRGTQPLDLRIATEEFWYNKVIRLWRGVSTPTLDWECAIGTFMPDVIESKNFPSTLHVTGRDFTKRLLLSKITEPIMFAAGTAVDTLVVAVCANAGIFNVVLPWDTTNPAPSLVTDTTFDASTSRWEIIKTILLGLNYEVFFDRYGYLIVRQFQDPYLMPPTFVFQTGRRVGNLVNWTKTATDARLFNHVVVVGGDDTGGIPVYAEAIVTDPNSPVYPGDATHPGIGDRLADPIQSITAKTPALAQALADSQLKYAALEEFALSMGGIVIPWLEGGNVIRFDDPDPGAVNDPTSFYLHDFTIPLDPGTMNVNANRIILVS